MNTEHIQKHTEYKRLQPLNSLWDHHNKYIYILNQAIGCSTPPWWRQDDSRSLHCVTVLRRAVNGVVAERMFFNIWCFYGMQIQKLKQRDWMTSGKHVVMYYPWQIDKLYIRGLIAPRNRIAPAGTTKDGSVWLFNAFRGSVCLRAAVVLFTCEFAIGSVWQRPCLAPIPLAAREQRRTFMRVSAYSIPLESMRL